MTETTTMNPLGTEPIGKLLRKFAIPSIIAMLVGSLYNMVDQLFIGNFVGPLGNGATNIQFPLSILNVSIALLCGIGAASTFNLAMGRGETEKAGYRKADIYRQFYPCPQDSCGFGQGAGRSAV